MSELDGIVENGLYQAGYVQLVMFGQVDSEVFCILEFVVVVQEVAHYFLGLQAPSLWTQIF